MDGDEHEERSAPVLLLPFYVNGTLSAADRAMVEAALAADPALRAELETVREIAGMVRSGGAGLTPANARTSGRLRALAARIDGKPDVAPAAVASPRRWLPARGAGAERPAGRIPQSVWRPAFAAAAVLVVVQAGLLLARQPSQAGYETLSGPETAAPATAERLLVRIARDARWAEVNALFASRELTIVGGPNGDLVDVAVKPGATVEDEVKALRASPLVEFAGPAA